MKALKNFPFKLSSLIWLAVLLGVSAVAVLVAQDFRIDSFTVDAAGTIRLRHAADANSYYILFRGAEVTRIATAADMALGVSGAGELGDANAVNPRAVSFYRIQRVPLSQPLDSDGDGIDDVYELRRSQLLNALNAADAAQDFDGDGVSNLDEYRNGTDPASGVPVTTITSSPANGETGVSVRRETVVRFSTEVAENTVIGPSELYAEFGGRRLLSRVELGTDRKSATLFYLEDLPGSARVRVSLDARNLKDARGQLVDADGDNQPGGVGVIEFDTLSVTEIASTAVVGRVFASETAPGPNNTTVSVNKPLAGVTITVDGREETLRATTDAMGNFKLEPVPAGRFFVHVDGRTAEGSQWPNGAYYPFVGKAWEAVAGRTDNLAGGTGEIYLPLIVPATLQTVSQTQDTPVAFPQEVVQKNPALAGVSITVPANSLFSENGVRGGKVGIAPVPPDRLPEKLPEGLNFPLVITVQTDGGNNFDRPVPVRFPNLPDPKTGVKLPPGAKTALWSFNHDTGEWEIAGPMTVTADGNFIESDPGFGITQPGWHGDGNGTPATGPKPPPKNPCEGLSTKKVIDTVIDLGVAAAKCAAEFAGISDGLKKALSIASEIKKLYDSIVKLNDDIKAGKNAGIAKNAMKSILSGKKIVIDGIEVLKQQSLFGKISKVAKCAESILGALDSICGRFVKGGQGPCSSSVWVQLTCIGIGEAKAILAIINRSVEAAEQSLTKQGIKVTCGLIDAIAVQLGLPQSSLHSTGSRGLHLNDNDPVPPEIAANIALMATAAEEMRSDFAPFFEAVEAASAFEQKMKDMEKNMANLQAEQNGLPGNAYYLIEISGLKFRGKTSDSGQIREILAPNSDYTVSIFDHVNGRLGVVTSRTAPNGFPTEIPLPLFAAPDDLTDGDNDGLADVFENVVGTDSKKPDSDGDGILDNAEVQQGTDPLSGLAARTGVVASIKTPGTVVDICTTENLAILAAQQFGVTICNIFSGLNPTVIAQVDTPGTARRVACAGNLLAVADESSGLAIVDIGNPSNARITRQLALGGSVFSVAASGGLAFAGLNTGEIVAVELLSGTVLARLKVDPLTIQDLALSGDYLYALSDRTLYVLSYSNAEMALEGSVVSPFVADVNRRLFVGGNVAYALHGKGYNTIDVANPKVPKLIKASNTAQFGWRHLVLNGSGLGVAAVDQNLAFDGPNDVSLYNTSDPTKTDAFLVTFPTPGQARAVSLFNGLAYIADGPAGLSVINYLAYDNLGQPPTVSISSNFAEGSAEEGKLMRITATVADDVQVRRVEFLVNGETSSTDGNYPFEHRFITPQITATIKSFTVQAIATDTGGNRSTSPLQTFNLVPDATPPKLTRIIPASGTGVSGLRRITAFFNEPVNTDSLSGENFFVVEAGADGKFGTADDRLLPGEVFSFDENLNAVYLSFPADFALGTYEIVLKGVTDRAGNALAETRTGFTAGMGLSAEYYDTIDFTSQMLRRLDTTIDFNWAGGSPDPSIGPDQFSVRWRGFVVPKFTETYTFHTVSDDGVRLWMNGQIILQNWTDHGATENASTPVALVAGQRYEVRMELYENGGVAVARLLWSSASQQKEIIPSLQLLPYEDLRPPAPLVVLPQPSFSEVKVRFSEPLDPASANNFANYSLSGGATVTGAKLQPNGTDVLLSTTGLAENTAYTLTVNGVRDASDQANAVAANSQVSFHSPGLASGFLRREVYSNIPGVLISDLTGSPKFPDEPDTVDYVSSFEAPVNVGDNYGQRVFGFITPPATGDYVFYMSSDDQGQLFLSTDDNPANKTLIASEPVWNPSRYWVGGDRRTPNAPENRSAPIRLRAGQRYYIEGLSKEQGGGDNLAVTWQFLGEKRPFFIEAEDFDFASGQHKPEASVMPYLGGAYANEAGVKGIDWNAASGGSRVYRPQNPEIGIAASVVDKSRMSFEITSDFKVGWHDADEWYNYTRNFPADTYHIYGRLSSGGQAISARLEEVVSGQKTATQQLQKLGEFKAPATGSYDAFTFVPLLDGNGAMARVSLSGERTVRFTMQPGNLDFNYLLFVPVGGLPEGPLSILPPVNGSAPIAGQYLAAPFAADGQGSLQRHVFLDIDFSKIDDLAASPKFPNRPDEIGSIRNFEAPINIADRYAQKLFGYLTPPVTGEYTFYLASDDQGVLFLSTDENPANKAEIAREPIWNNSRAWTSFFQRDPNAPENRSKPISLVAGRKYYIEAWMKDTTGGDHLAVTWRLPGQDEPGDGTAPIAGAYLSTQPAPARTGFALAPQDQKVDEESAVTFVGLPSGAPPFHFQWFRNGQPIEGATSANYTISSALVKDDGTVFTLEITSLGGKTTSSPARLSVVPDLAPPSLIEAIADMGNRVALVFSESMDLVSATDLKNFAVNGGLTLVSASLSPDGRRVVLTTSPQAGGTAYTVTVNGLTDDAQARNVIAANSTKTFTALATGAGFLNREVYRNIPGTLLENLRGNSKFPDFADEKTTVNLFETPVNIGDNYGVRLSGFLTPTVSGEYVFYMASDDQGQLFLSTDENPANKKPIASEPQWNASRAWTGTARRNATTPENVSAPVVLEAGRRYYVEAVMKEEGGGDSLGVAWKPPGQAAAPANGSEPIGAANLAGWVVPAPVGPQFSRTSGRDSHHELGRSAKSLRAATQSAQSSEAALLPTRP